MIKVVINKEIGRYWGISETDISEQLQAVTPGEDIEVSINSPGGEVYEGIAIFNLIREYAKSHNIIVKINGLAASMASYIAIAARTINKDSKIIVSENSIFLIHNPWNIIMGDYRELLKEADILQRLAAMLGSTYAYISEKTEKETRALMDAETYFVGNEVLENGFANEYEEINKNEESALETDRNGLIINAKLRIEKTFEKMRATAKADLEKAAALITNTFLPSEASDGVKKSFEPTPGPAGSGVHFENSAIGSQAEKEGTGGTMNKDELKAKYPELYAAIYGEGKEAGIKDERERVEAHLKLGEDSGSMKIAAQFIREGKSVMENKVQAEYLSARMNNAGLKAREQDNPPPINGAGESGAADDAAMEAAWNHGMAGKDTGGIRL